MPGTTGGVLGEFLERLPKTETHLHIEGALPWELLHGLDGARFPHPPASWDKDFRFRDFAHFEKELLDMACAWHTSPDRYHESARLVFRRLCDEERVRYVETSFASGMIEFLGLDGRAVAEAIKAAAPAELTVRVYLGIHHNGYHEGTRGFIEDALGWEALDGLDLHGTETLPLEPWTADLWRRAREAGKHTKAHAGEFMGPAFVRRVMDELGVSRIQHGVRAAESPELLAEMRQRGTILDVCPISNLKLGVVPSMEAHPIGVLLEAGVACTISTDDPISFGNRLRDEYVALHTHCGLSLNQLGQLAANGFRHALGDGVPFHRWISEIENLVEAYSPLD